MTMAGDPNSAGKEDSAPDNVPASMAMAAPSQGKTDDTAAARTARISSNAHGPSTVELPPCG